MMILKEQGIEYKIIPNSLIATIRFNLKGRKELHSVINELSQSIPQEYILGPAFCIYHFVSSVKEGFDVEVGFPISHTVETGEIKTRMLPQIEVLSMIHEGTVEKIGESTRKLYSHATEQGVVSDEFSREVFIDSNNPVGKKVELQFIIHNWNQLLAKNLERVLGEEKKQEIMQENNQLSLDSPLDERVQWLRRVMESLDKLATEDQKYDILSSCAHVFPSEPIEKARKIYENIEEQTKDPLKAIDAVIEFMEKDPAWPKPPFRSGNIIYSSKMPRDPKKYEEATNESEKRKAYCFCPLVRNHLDKGVPKTFCYCGAGWYRRQWEGTIGKPVRIEIVKSILNGDDLCKFAIYLPEDL
ncbi:MAG: hypothetical protein JSV04_13170 [Candidatus Heimdallarchaeota archaeon]|nr:MAG: hypothetical protein JSV04_13170 [Candidatus Heimdallarchaeota archaeon]